ncbi:MAG TPA: hypothetical protein VFX61_07815 [Micromonosporaceae bacterium]|nr:hypothetical protein [Micromonosporaceae bacterium]
MNTAVREGIIARNPCQIPGAGTVRAAERPVATPAHVVVLVGAINPRYRTAVLIAAWCGLRRGKIAGLRVSDVDLIEHTITVRKARVEPLHDRGKAFDKDPKSEAGKRTIAIPPHVVPVIRLHLDEYAGKDRLFVSRDGSCGRARPGDRESPVRARGARRCRTAAPAHHHAELIARAIARWAEAAV